MSFLNRLSLALVWVLILLGVAGLSAAYIRPTVFWPLALVAIVLPGVCLLLCISLFFSAAIKRWVPFILALAVIVAVVDRHTSFRRWLTPAPDESDLTVMTYNAPKGEDDPRDARPVTSLVSSVDPDVIAFQEAVVWALKSSPDRLRTHRKLQPLVDSLGYVATMPPRGGPPGMRWTHWEPPVILKFPPDDQEELEVGGGNSGWPEFDMLRTELTWKGRKLALYNVHLTSHGVGKPWTLPGGLFSWRAWRNYLSEVKNGFNVREWQVDQVREWLDAEELPVVLVGDFNSTPDSWTYHRLSRGLQDAYRESGSWWGATYHSRHPIVRIDFVLLAPEFEPVHSYVPNPHTEISDHRPLVAQFRWR